MHGSSDDHSIWLRRTSIERYAAEYGIAVVMPAVGRSYYCDMAYDRKLVFGDSADIPAEDDLFALAAKLATSRPLDARPRFFQCCGTEDFLYQDTDRFGDHCRKRQP